MRASESDRAVACPYSLVAPELLARRVKADAAASYGTLVHAWKETGEAGDGPDAMVLQKKLLLSGVDRDILWPKGGNHEVTFVIRILKAKGHIDNPPHAMRYTGPREGADEWKKSYRADAMLTGTIDYEGEIENGTPWIDDLKTGRWPVDAKKSKQLRSYALLPWVEAGCPEKYRVRTTITQWPMYPLSAQPVRTPYTLTAFDLMEHLEALQYTLLHPDETNLGDHCTFCDAREPHAGSSWQQHYRHRAFPFCIKGACAHAENV